jgi:hypothetical protein
LAHADFNPVELTPGSYTQDIVVEAGTVQALPSCINVTAGNGVLLGDNTYYEQGLYARPGLTGGNSGIPLHNTTFTSISNANMTFLMPPDYTTNNELMIDASYTSGTFSFNSSTTATNLAILCSGGGGALTVNYTVTHSDASTETGTLSLLDWFKGGSTVAWGANGRITQTGGYNNYNSSSVNNNPPYLYANTITVSGASPITSITFDTPSGNHGNFLAVSGKASGTAWTPISVGGFNVRAIVPAAFPLTATMDQGTNTAYNGNGLNTWFEQGFDQGISVGLPPSGSIFSSQSQSTHYYQMGNYSSNNAILIDTNHQIANIIPANPTNLYSTFALLTAGGNVGGSSIMTNICILQHQDGVNETNLFYGYDWFNTANSNAIAYKASGRVNMYSRTVNNIGAGTPYLFETYFTLNDAASPVTNIVVKYKTAPNANSTTYIMAVSASAGGVAPIILSGPLPAAQTWYPSQTATFTVSVSGTAPVTNSWLVESNGEYVPLTDGVDANGSTISGSGTTTLTISNLTLADGANYEYVASNAFGQASATALLAVNAGTPVAPIIDSQSPSNTVNILTNHIVSTTFSVTIDTNTPPPFFYQWYSGATAIPNATGASYVNVDTNSTSIYCVITNFVGATTSSPVAVVIFSAPVPSTYASAILAYNPVAYWPLTETNGAIAFDYAGTNDGTYTGGYVLGQGGLPATAGIGANTSVAFDGTNGCVQIPVGRLNITNALTVIAWAQIGSEMTNNANIVGHSDTGYRLFEKGGVPRFADSADINGSASIADGQWHQLVGVSDGTNQYLYVDGQVAGTNSSKASGTTANVLIGGAPDYTNRYFSGNIAQVAILTNALTVAQVAAIYASLDTPPLITSVTPTNPSVDSGNNLTLTANLSGTPATSLQWYYIDNSGNSNNIAGATNATYTIAAAPISYNGYTFGVIAANAYGTNSAGVLLSVQEVAAYLATGGDLSPLNGEAYVGAPVTYTVNAQGSWPISYQWLMDGTPVSGVKGNSYTFPAALGGHTIQVSFTNAQSGGVGVLSSVAVLQGDANPTNITFNTNGLGWQLNTVGAGGVPTLAGNVLELTDNTASEAASAFYGVAQYVGSFTASFTYTGNGSADGAAFILQNSPAGINALGGVGGSLGYAGITNSLALEINLYNGNGENIGIALGTNGIAGAKYGATGPVSVNSGNPIQVGLKWVNGVLTVSLTDTKTLATYATNYTIGSLTPILGGSDLAYIGFSGADGGITSIQTVSDFEFNSGTKVSSNASLTSLAVNPPAGILSNFATNVYLYAVTNYLPNNPVMVTVNNADLTATNTLLFNGANEGGLASGAQSGALILNQGVTNVLVVQVVAQDGVTTNNYTVNVMLQPNQTLFKLTNSVSGGTNLLLTWPVDHIGYRLLMQTNNLSKGVSSNTNDWADVPGAAETNAASITILKTNLNEYYRLVYP